LAGHTPRRATVRLTAGAVVRGYPALPLRRLIARGYPIPVERLPGRVRRALDLNGGKVAPLRVEIGCGPSPTPGYVHVDADWRARHLEHVAPAWRLPFASGTVDEILAVHVLEHVHPARLQMTLREWKRVVRPGAWIEVHVPNARTILAAYLDGDTERKWAAMSAIFGTPCDPAARRADQVGTRHWPEHQAIYDFALLEEVLSDNGFEEVEDLTDKVVDAHTEAWQHLIPQLSMVVRARRPLG
jgi:predicted SAM-dependent methyltransferase